MLVVLCRFLFVGVGVEDGAADCLNASQYFVRNYTEDDDWLPSSVTTSVLRDKTGCIWVATRRGVVCYSGYFMSTNEYSASGNYKIHYLDCDSRNRVWGVQIGDSLIVRQLNGEKQRIRPVNISLPDKNTYSIWANGSLFSVCSYKSETTAAVGIVGYGIYVYRRGAWQFIGESDNLNPSNMTGVLAEGRNVYICSKDGLYYLDDKGVRKIYNTPVLALRRSEREPKRLWFLTPTSFGYRDHKRNFHTYPNKLSVSISDQFSNYRIQPDFSNKFVYSDRSGIYSCDLSDPNAIDKLGIDRGLVGDVASAMCLDNDNSLWVATFGGLSKVYLSLFSNFNQKNSGMLENVTTSIVVRNDTNIVLLHTTGFSVFNGRRITSTHKYNLSQAERIPNAVKDRNGNIWCAAYSNGILKISPNNTVKQYSPKLIGTSEITSIACDSSNEIIACDGTNFFELLGESFKKINIRIPDLQPGVLRRMIIGQNNKIYIATK